MIILTTIAIFVFLTYIIACNVIFGIPLSLSETYYLLEDKRKGLGVLFTLVLWVTGGLLLPPLLDSLKGNTFQFTAFFTCTSLCFVGAAPRFKTTEKVIHYISALLSALNSLMVVFLLQNPAIYVFTIVVVLTMIIATYSWKSWLYWIEMVCHFAIFFTLCNFFAR